MSGDLKQSQITWGRRGKEKVKNHGSRVINMLCNETMQKVSSNLSKGALMASLKEVIQDDRLVYLP